MAIEPIRAAGGMKSWRAGSPRGPNRAATVRERIVRALSGSDPTISTATAMERCRVAARPRRNQYRDPGAPGERSFRTRSARDGRSLFRAGSVRDRCSVGRAAPSSVAARPRRLSEPQASVRWCQYVALKHPFGEQSLVVSSTRHFHSIAVAARSSKFGSRMIRFPLAQYQSGLCAPIRTRFLKVDQGRRCGHVGEM